jgi:molybdate transport system substrate-binding protein
VSADIRVLSTTAMKTTLDEVVPEFERTAGVSLSLTYAPSARTAKQIAEGLAGDIAFITEPQLDDLAAKGLIVDGSITPVAGSHIGVAVQAGAHRPDIATVEAFRRAIVDARSIGMSNPVGGGASGAHMQKVYERLGIADVVKPKVTYGPGGPEGLIGLFLKRGEIELGIQQMAELMAVPGIDILGPLPDAIQATTVFALGTMRGTHHGDVAKALAAHLRGPKAQAVLRAKGMEPA